MAAAAWATGPGPGGKAIAAFQEAGTRVMVADIDESGAALAGAGVAFRRCDITDDAQVAALVADTVKEFGRVDFLVDGSLCPKDGPSSNG